MSAQSHITESEIRDALRACYPPGLAARPHNIVDLGLVHSISLTLDPEAPGANIPGVPPKSHLHLTLFALSDPDSQTILHAQILNRLAGLPRLSGTTLTSIPQPFPILHPGAP